MELFRPTHTVPHSDGDNVNFGQFAVIFTFIQSTFHKFKSHTRLETIQFDVATMRIHVTMLAGCHCATFPTSIPDIAF